MFKLPQFQKYPKLIGVEQCPEIIGLYCYIIQKYEPGFSILIKRSDGSCAMQIGDWYGNQDISSGPIFNDAKKFIETDGINILGLMQAIELDQIQLFVSDGGKIADAQIAMDKFLGPGMLRDLFGTQVGVCETIEITHITDEKIEQTSDAIIKPTKFRTIMRDGNIIPLYAQC